VAAPEQRVTVEQALRGVTIDAAYSLRLESEIGTITPGKRANFTVLSDNPLAVDVGKLRDIAVRGTVMEGRALPVASGPRKASREPATRFAGPGAQGFEGAALQHVLTVAHWAD
jgi:adenine deaminase